MKRLLFACLLTLVATAASAQVTVGPGTQIGWDQPTTEIANVARYEAQIDTGAFTDVGKVLATATPPPNMTTYKLTLPALTTGNHALVVRACPAAGACTAASSPFSFTMFILSVPTGVRSIPGDDGMESEF